jgi:hypothetical protein
MANKSELEALLVLAGKVDPSLKKALEHANKQTKTLNNTTKFFGTVASKAFTAMKIGAAAGAAGIGAAMVFAAKKGLDLASDLTEVQNVVDVTFGQNANAINVWAKNAKRDFGLSELAAKQFNGTMGAILKSTGIADDHITTMSKTMAGLSADFASFYNLKSEEAFEKIRSGISGETEPLKQLGINMSVANLEAYALAQGIKTAYSKMNAADQAILRYNYLLSVSKDAQGDFTRNIDSFANQKRIWTTNLQEFAAGIMKRSIPAMERLMKQGNELIESFMDDPEKMQRVQDMIEGTFNRAIELVPVAINYAKQFAQGVGDVYAAGKRAYDFIDQNWRLIGPLIYTIVGAMLAWKTTLGVIATYKAITTAATTAQKLLNVAKMKDLAVTAYLQALYAKDAIVKAGSTIATWGWTAATKASRVATLAATAAQWAMNAAWLANPITWIVIGVVAAVAALIGVVYLLIKYWDQILAGLKAAWEWFQSLIKSIPDFALVLTGPIAPLLLLIKHFDKVKELATGAIGAVKKFFGIGGDSDAVDTVKDVPKFARGGIATRPSIFGEAGPEMAIPIKRTPRSLGLLNKTAQMLGVGSNGGRGENSSRGGTVTFVYSPTYGSGTSESQVRSDFEAFKRMMEEWLEDQRRESFA